MNIELTAQEYKDIFSTINVFKEGAVVKHYNDNDDRIESVIINDTECMRAIEHKVSEDCIRYFYYYLNEIPTDYLVNAPFVATINVENWEGLKNVLVAAGVATEKSTS